MEFRQDRFIQIAEASGLQRDYFEKRLKAFESGKCSPYFTQCLGFTDEQLEYAFARIVKDWDRFSPMTPEMWLRTIINHVESRPKVGAKAKPIGENDCPETLWAVLPVASDIAEQWKSVLADIKAKTNNGNFEGLGARLEDGVLVVVSRQADRMMNDEYWERVIRLCAKGLINFTRVKFEATT